MTARLDVTPKTTEQNRIVCSKSEAEVTNNKKNALGKGAGAVPVTTLLLTSGLHWC